MAKVDKMEQKYQMLKSGDVRMKYNPFDEKMKKSYKSQMKNSYRSQMGKIKLEISRLESDLIKADERKEDNKEIKEKLEELRKEKKELEQDNQKLKNETNKLNSEISFNQLEKTDGLFGKYVEKKISKNLLEGFLKNHEAIDRIIELRDNTKEAIKKLETKLEKEKEQAKKYEEIEQLEARVEAGKEINSTISNEEYLALVSELEEKRASLGKKPNVEKIEKEIESKKMMVTKCNLAWKCLFRNETWDDIHIKAVRINSQKKVKQEEIEQQENIEEQEVQQNHEENEEVQQISVENREQTGNTKQRKSIGERVKNWFFEEENEEIEQENDNNMVVYDEFARKHPVFAKIRDAFKNRFGKKKENNIRNQEIEQQENIEQEVPQQGKKAIRDPFIEGLRVHVEKDNEQKEALNQEYTEKQNKHDYMQI